MKIRNVYVKVALKMMGKTKREAMAELSRKQFVEKVRNSSKASKMSDEEIDMMYDELIKKVNKK